MSAPPEDPARDAEPGDDDAGAAADAAAGDEHITVEVSAASREQAETIARAAVHQRLAASAQIAPVRTVYRWRGAVHETDEHVVRLFTRRARFAELAACVRQHHSYELPQVVAVPIVQAEDAFRRWIDEHTAPAPAGDGDNDDNGDSHGHGRDHAGDGPSPSSGDGAAPAQRS
ncbi:divalent-cation tolerance protein CutA [Haliangium ochraceum]|uniref:CutA1 divalent ion tolerance protein n=1 Tax=Haliangium ochraceum (strain DSM 14365 / JCM 11303 / SMP-2) TaxID=502025 RepID=D0LTN4_HALO1|nr:divalent-cation tolerance protein CutA [Haliangium ochraceum]ACY15728.1 CutA1 divalent ion tolerance protein [Haliangium ochraceum DSM 14365]